MSNTVDAMQQYEVPPAEGLLRFWISWYTPEENPWPRNVGWRYWISGYGADDDAVICALIDATGETAAWDAARAVFPNLKARFCDGADNQTLASLAKGGRFT